MNDHTTHKFHYPKTLETRIVRFSTTHNWGSKQTIHILYDTVSTILSVDSCYVSYQLYAFFLAAKVVQY